MYEIIGLSLFIGGIAFVGGETLRRKLKASNEVSRKLVHLLHGLVLTSWAFIAPYWFIIVVELLFLACVLAVRYLHLLPWLYKVGRISYGDYLYPVGVIFAVLLADTQAILAVAILQLALADSMAAIVGKRWGASRRYKTFGQTKSVAGSVAFYVVSTALIGLFMATGLLAFSWALLVLVPVVLTAVEALAGYGLDNALIPVTTVLLLNLA